MTVSLSPATIENALKGLGAIDLPTAWAQLTSGDIQQELIVGEEAADILSAIWPEAQYVEDVMKLIGFVIALRQAGFWSPAQPEDPSMQQAARPDKHGGR